MSEYVLEAVGLGRRFREGDLDVPVLSHIDLRITPGMQLAVVGASGSGKSTLLQLLGGLDRPTEGQVNIWGRDWQGMSEAERGRMRNRHVGFVYQFHHLLPEFTALENVAMPMVIRGVRVREAESAARGWLERVGLVQRVRHKPSELSGGERQRVAIARALVTEPDVLLADEPTGNLDRERAEQVFSLLLEMNSLLGSALVVVTHDLDFAARMAEQIRIDVQPLPPSPPVGGV
jgi:lipoprotein-releasing system ATP-binding protein